MDEDDDIVAALRRGEDGWEYAAADEIEALRAENARLREALKPFTAKFDEEGWQAIQTAKDSDWFRWVCTAGEIRAARAAMGESDE